MRNRGWSIEEKADDTSPSRSKKRSRPRSNTEDTLTAAEKLELLNSFPTNDELEKASHHDSEELKLNNNNDNIVDKGNGNGDGDVGGKKDKCKEDEDIIDMFGDSDSHSGIAQEHDVQPTKKRHKGNDAGRNSTMSNSNSTSNSDASSNGNGQDLLQKEKQEMLLQKAKGRLSKWASRLFDPNRPRGLVEAPEVIPLNDEFLTQFGQREKEFHVKIGKEIEIEEDDLDDMDGITAVDDNNNNKQGGDNDKDASKLKLKSYKVKISNLAYTTKEKALMELCQTYGVVSDVNLLMDEQNITRSKGRAYVAFQHEADAQSFCESMDEKSFQGRQLRITVATDRPRPGRDSIGGGKKVGMARYWEKDITTKCFRCGGVGHMSNSCPNEVMAKPCPLCAKTGHDSYSCALNRICFNCGIPGHINRECSERRGMPKRIVCGACFISGHHRWECHEKIHNIPTYGATCFVCSKDGHFMCDSMKWFFGLKGISCFNCGRKGHHGSKCDRPVVDECARNSDLLVTEIERAEARSLEDELEEQRQKSKDDESGRSRGRDRNSSHRDRNKAKSQPPSRFRPDQSQSSNYGRIQNSSHRRDQSRSPRPGNSDQRGYGGRGGHKDSTGGSSRGGGNRKDSSRGSSRGGGHRSSSGGSTNGGRRNSSGSRGYK